MAFCVCVDRRAIGEDGGEHYFIARKAFGEREKQQRQGNSRCVSQMECLRKRQ